DTRSQNSTMPLIYQLASIGLLLSLISHVAQSGSPDSQQLSSQCQACSAIAAAFQRGLERTARDNFGGGNTNWEETRLGTYALSETRLVDITDRLCKDKDNEMDGVTSSECHAMLEKIEEDIEKFWFGAFKANPTSASLRDSVCVNGTAACCAYGRWGPECAPCPDCSGGRGDCNGNGTRTGTGACDCHPGYSGAQCSDCSAKYYRANGESNGECKACSPACRSACTGPLATQCDQCADGYETVQQADGAACVDIDECQTRSPCSGPRSFCENLPGSYRCGDCDRACSACSGPGQVGCTACSPGFEPATTGSGCQDVNECSPDSPHCTGPYERCVNLPGSYRCDCQPGYQRSGSQCVPKPAASSKKSANSKQTKKGQSGNKKGKPPKLIWTVAYTIEFAKFFGAIVGLAVFAVAVKGRPAPVTVAACLAGWYLCKQSSVLDRVYLHAGRR
ncbi:hypothetical protein BOX15_Mlig014948g1, partial [Macrostomum lignano]